MHATTNHSAAADSPSTAADPLLRAYPSDVTDLQWRQLEPLVTGESTPTGRPRTVDLRRVLSALHYRWQTDCAWRMLPHDFPPWGTVYTYQRQWERAGLLPEIRRVLSNRRLR